MPWFKVDDGFATSAPVLRIPRRYRAAAVGLWTLAGTWSSKELKDGFVPDYAIEDFCCSTPAIAQHLVLSGLWEKSGSGFQFVGWSKYQFTKAKVMEHRAAEAEKKRKWREAKAGKADQQDSEMSPRDTLGDTGGIPEGTSTVSTSTRPDPTRPVLSLVTTSEEVTLVNAQEPPPSKCSRHSNIDKPPPCGRCGEARVAREEWDAEKRRAESASRAAALQARLDCSRCDESGLILDANDDASHCNHQEAM